MRENINIPMILTFSFKSKEMALDLLFEFIQDACYVGNLYPESETEVFFC